MNFSTPQAIPIKAFGKFHLGRTAPLRSFEVAFGIGNRTGPKAWKSSLTSVQRLLDHLARYTKSDASREKYLRHLLQFCGCSGLNPEDLVELPKKRIEFLVQKFVDDLAAKDCSRAYLNTVIKRLRTFFCANGYVGNREPNIQRFFVPTRYRKIPEYIPTKTEIYSMADAADNRRDRAMILGLWSTGSRVSTFCSLNYSDVTKELEKGVLNIMIRVYPAMKDRLPDACKGCVPYYTFTCLEASEALRSYLKEREEKYGPISSEDALFSSDWNLWSKQDRPKKRIGRRGVESVVKKSARLAGIEQWKKVTPHCLRKAYETVLRSPTIDGGRLDKGTQEFLMGHILPGSQDAYYDKTKIDFHRREYAKLDFSRGGMRSKAVDLLIDIGKLEEHLKDGWMFVAKVSDQKAVVRRRH